MNTIANRLMDNWISVASLPILACALIGCSADTDVPSATNAQTQAALSKDPNPKPLSNFSPVVVGDPAVGRDVAGRITVFVRGIDNALWYNVKVTYNGGWGGWRQLGGEIASSPVVAPNADGRLSVFVRGAAKDALLSITQVAANGEFGAWTNLGGIITSDPQVARNTDGTLEVIARGSDNAVWFIRQTEPSSAAFTPWATLGGKVNGQVAVAPNADGRLSVFVRTEANVLSYCHQNAPKGTYSEWESLSGQTASPVTAQRGVDGRLHVFYIGANEKAVWQIPQSAPNGEFSKQHVNLGGVFVAESKLAVSRQADGKIVVVGRTAPNALSYLLQTAPTADTFVAPAKLPGVYVSNPAIGDQADARLVVFGASVDAALWSTTQLAPNGIFGTASIVD